jgi:hypothetical protein
MCETEAASGPPGDAGFCPPRAWMLSRGYEFTNVMEENFSATPGQKSRKMF